MEAWRAGLKSLYYARTVTLNRADNVGKKIERIALQDADESASSAQEENECVSCQG
jgi:hypothetical protein